MSLARDGGSENGFCLSSAILRFILQKEGIQQARDIYKRYVLKKNLASLFKSFSKLLCSGNQDIFFWYQLFFDWKFHMLSSHCRFLALPHPGLVLYRNCIDLETNIASIGDKEALMNARKLYESALASYDQDVKLWQDYYQMESKV